MSHRSIIILPDDTATEILNAIETARESIYIKMFLFSDPGLIKAIIDAKKRGVKVKVMLNPTRNNGEEENQETRKMLEEAGVEVRDSNPFFTITHEKSMVIDEQMAFIKSLNWDTKNLTETRDYAIITTHRHEVKEIILCFEADWYRHNFEPGENMNLIWCSNNGRTRIARFIDETKDSLFIQNERFQDLVIIERLVHAAKRGVKIHVMARPPHTLRMEKLVEGVGGLRIMHDVGIKIHKLNYLKLHGKMLLSDGSRAIIGSINLTPGSFDHRRELAIEVHDEEVIKRLHKIAHFDWENSHALDLSDQGLLQDMENMGKGGIEKIVLEENSINKINHKHN